jgi:UDP-3-O-acyl-N-acetylglucosamine deacetylase
LADVPNLAPQQGVALGLTPHPSGFKGSYTLHYPDTPALNGTTGYWQVGDDPALLLASQTFGHVAELPALQAKGYALGVSADNTLGLLGNGEFTRPLRHASEPHLHKLLDFIGDFRLTGVNPLNVAMQVQAIAAGHSTHIALAQHAVQTNALRPLP